MTTSMSSGYRGPVCARPGSKHPANDEWHVLGATTILACLKHSLGNRDNVDLEHRRVSFNFPIALPGGYRSLFSLLDVPSPAAAGHRLFFRDRTLDHRSTSVGLGTSAVIDATGERRFETIRAASERLLAEIRTIDHESLESWPSSQLEPRLYGGFAFTPGSADPAPWQAPLPGAASFGDARFVLPSILVRCYDDSRQALLTVTTRPEGDLSLGRRADLELLALVQAVLHRLRCPLPSQPIEDTPPFRASLYLNGFRPRVERQVSRALHAMAGTRTGEQLEKIVIAHHADLSLGGELDAPSRIDQRTALSKLVRRLDSVAEGDSTFALALGKRLFLGAPPERLVAVRGKHLETEAVAGSLLRSDSDKSEPLDPNREAELAQFATSSKDLREHHLVVDHLTKTLSPLCRDLTSTSRPRIRALPSLYHLETPFRARLKEDIHVLDLVAKLHPTPAVCGTPHREAISLLARLEDEARGWYAGPVGWFDRSGSGEFVVALRSALISGSSARLFAGAGIVDGSEPELEALEIERKLVPMIRVLAPYLGSKRETIEAEFAGDRLKSRECPGLAFSQTHPSEPALMPVSSGAQP